MIQLTLHTAKLAESTAKMDRFGPQIDPSASNWTLNLESPTFRVVGSNVVSGERQPVLNHFYGKVDNSSMATLAFEQ
jgi:hypothetical protein